jgi:hypothetical protein
MLIVSDEVPMAVQATWTVASAGPCHVTYQEQGGPLWRTPTQDCFPKTTATAVLRGLHADTEIEVTAVLTLPPGEHTQSAETTTHPLPEGVPVFNVEVPWSSEDDGGYIQGSFSEEQAGVFILDRHGRYVYLWMNGLEQRRDIFNARLADDLSGFWLLLNDSRVAHDWGLLVKRDWFGETRRIIDVPYAHHDLLPMADDSVLVIEGIPDDLEAELPIWGERIVQVHPDDSTTVLWSAWNDLVPPDELGNINGWFGDGADWLHANSLAWHPDRETVLLGSAQLHSLYEIDGATGELLRTLGGDDPGSWAVDGDPFQHPHGSHWTDQDTLMMLSTDRPSHETTAVEYSLDEDRQLLMPTWSRKDPDHYAKIGGNAVRRGDSGHILVNYGSDLTLQEVDSDGKVIWQVSVENTNIIFQVWPVADLWGDTEE